MRDDAEARVRDPVGAFAAEHEYLEAIAAGPGRVPDWRSIGPEALDGRETQTRRPALYATIRRYEDVTDPAEAGRRVNEDFVPLIKQIPGFVAYYWVDAGEGVMASTSIFQDQSGAVASTERAAAWVRENIAPLLPTPPIVVAGEVVASG